MTQAIIALAAGLAIGAALCAAMYERELRRMARLLFARDETSNGRVTVAIPGAGARDLARAINAQLDRIQDERIAARHRQRDFQRGLSALSHDVRTPLTGAKGHIQLAHDALAGSCCDASFGLDVAIESDAAREREARACALAHLDAAETRLDDTRSLLDKLFVYARAEDADARLNIEDVAAFPLLVNVLAGHMPDFERAGFEPHVDFSDEALRVPADAEALTRIFDNLVENALRHGGCGLSIVQRGREVAFSNRVAAPQDIDVDRLFERFYRADGSRAGGGAGLGLAVVKRLAEAMGMEAFARFEGDTLSIILRFGRPV